MACLVVAYGCGQQPAKEKAGETAHEHDHGHDHEMEGPHGGHIIELGTEDHHAELTHDDASQKVAVYILGSDAKTANPIKAESVTINVSEDGQPTQYVLPAVPQAGETDGNTSYFELVSEPLNKVVSGKSEAKSTQARLSLTINDKPFVGMIETSAHDHDHDHGHGDEH
jgi:hypothetical protein